MSHAYPWYDAGWLTKYTRAKQLLARIKPERLKDFVETFEVLRTRPDFQVRHFSRVFSESELAAIKEAIRTLQKSRLEFHEIQNFGRFVVHDDPFLTELQQATVPLVSEAVGEAVEASYNFLSIYTKLGNCPVHMDSPEAKYTLDVCIDQSEPWPIYFSQVQPWPEHFHHAGTDWQDAIKNSPNNQFTAYTLEPGKAVVFSGSSQWHYRNPQSPGTNNFCHLVFFHFVPKGMRELVNPKNWQRLFEIPELGEVL